MAMNRIIILNIDPNGQLLISGGGLDLEHVQDVSIVVEALSQAHQRMVAEFSELRAQQLLEERMREQEEAIEVTPEELVKAIAAGEVVEDNTEQEGQDE